MILKVSILDANGKYTYTNGTKATLNIQYNEATKRFELKGYPKGVEDFKHTLSHSNLYIQQQVPSHLMDEENKIGTQLQKRILDNLVFNGDYTIGSTVRKGKLRLFL